MIGEKIIPVKTSTYLEGGKRIEEMYQRTQHEVILYNPDSYIGSMEKQSQNLWVWENDGLVKRFISFVPGLFQIFDSILVDAANNKQRDLSMDCLKVKIDSAGNLISIYSNGNIRLPVEFHNEQNLYVPELLFENRNYSDMVNNAGGYGVMKLASIFSTELVFETADGERKKKYKQVLYDNMTEKTEPEITNCEEGESWTQVSFKPDLKRFKMDHLEKDVVALMEKRVIDIAGCLGQTVSVELNGQRVPVRTFVDYITLYLRTPETKNLKRLYKRLNDRWEICVFVSEGPFQQVSFVNGIATIEGGSHVSYVTDRIADIILRNVKTNNRKTDLKANRVKDYLWVFINAMIDNPAFDSQAKETLTTQESSIFIECQLERFLQKVIEKGLAKNLLLRAGGLKQKKALKKPDGTTN